MNLIIFCIILILLCLPLIKFRKQTHNPFEDKNVVLPYFRRTLMTPTELEVYATLLDALPEYMVFTQVQASRVLEVPSNAQTYYWFNLVSRLSYDFVICRTDSTPIAAIEIDDSTHDLPERQEADNRKNKATEAAGVAMIRWKVGETPSENEIKKLIRRIDKRAE
ncbi:DUF2726 domain-containing protein [Kingella negevensis]|uniref:DUF2726 domain-containing protein n=1 Tax=Kingella negevensis TaxID=1522312 RepID=A0A238HGQ2_9NEIS|nr:DUF2726 domain-containing protein [Kingella negevensis]MDK4680559.1 DUF2726 domain-containing protein [Kingella negevensis]MDK4681718.1 DUF2726 domain-containing protein [Kingella negevensis]MDK4684715.1 DUF2726 domain-containing protein [Kingella negevensis]MDK4689170.1 DUF2726 domain-containing protein [Kingella negevensis]MDK4689916.1 DUF2726 domain-containing protein [Kingella negevensis]